MVRQSRHVEVRSVTVGEAWRGKTIKAYAKAWVRAGIKNKGENKMVYEWAKGSQHKVSAQIAGEVCAELERSGRLTASELVDVSRPEDAPLHDEFEWNDSEAAEKYRVYQARNVINAIKVVREEEGETTAEPNHVRAFFTLKRDESHYESIQIILSDEDKYNELMRVAVRELMAVERKYNKIKELGRVFEEVDKVVSAVMPEMVR